MKPNKFSKLAQKSLTLTAQIVLIVIAVATIFAVVQEIGHIWEAGSVAVGDLLMLFLYLEVMSMLNHYLGSGNLPVRYPLYIGIIALARFLVLDIKDIDAFKMFAISGSILLIAAAILIVRYGHVRYPYSEDN
ncbi:MAG: phosphate-starvation-inducible PsiE family protein [Bacteroidota bacterium]|jgi:protein PsiE